MCLAVPGKIVEITEGGDGSDASPAGGLGPVAVVDFQGNRVDVSLATVPQAQAGQWVLVHAGFAIAVLDEAEARETWEYLQAGGLGEMPDELQAQPAAEPQEGPSGE